MQIRMTFRGKTYIGALHALDDKRNVAHVHFGSLVGMREVNWNHGHGVGAFSDWKVEPVDLELLREHAREEGREVNPCGRSRGRPRKPRAAKPPHPKHRTFEQYLEEK